MVYGLASEYVDLAFEKHSGVVESEISDFF